MTIHPPAHVLEPAPHAEAGKGQVYTIIRLRGTQNLNPKAKDTLKYLRLNRVNHAVVLPQNATTKGMLQVAKDYVTWGEVDAATLATVIRAHGRLEGDKPLSDAHLAKTTPHKTVEALATAIVAGSFHYKDIPDVKPLFRLHPARKGLEGIKRAYTVGGALGYRGREINKLLSRMTEAKSAIGSAGDATRAASDAKARGPAIVKAKAGGA
jgi:large subunit ribosomal protein L30